MKKKATHKKISKNLAASRAHIWTSCPGSVDFEKVDNIFQKNSEASIGNLIHKISASHLEKIKDGKKGYERVLDFNKFISFINFTALSIEEKILFEENQEEIHNQYVFYLTRILYELENFPVSGRSPEILVEYRLQYKNIVAIADCILYVPDKYAVIIDLKTGFVEVEAEANKQLLITAGLFKKFHGVNEVEIEIIQPKHKSIKKDILNYIPKPQEILKEFTAEKGKLKAGPHCLYCPSNDICPELRGQIEKYLNPKYQDTAYNRPAVWSELLDVSKPIIKTMEKIRSNSLNYLKLGEEIPGYSLGYRGGSRAWINTISLKELSIFKRAGIKELFRETLKSPAQLETELKALIRRMKKEGSGIKDIRKKEKIDKKIITLQEKFESLIYKSEFPVLKRNKENN